MTCQHFTYCVDKHCCSMVGCNLRQKQLHQDRHLKKRCNLWARAWQKEVDVTLQSRLFSKFDFCNICSKEVFKGIEMVNKIIQAIH